MKQKTTQKPKANVYIDGANMYFAQKKLGWRFDWQKLFDVLINTYAAEEIYYYSGLKTDDLQMKEFLERLRGFGYQIVTKPLKKIRVGDTDQKSSSPFIFKANFDVEITADMLLMKDDYDVAILFSGDSDFEYVIKKCQSFGKKVIVFGVERGLSQELRKCADEIVMIGSLRERVEYRKPRSENRGSLNGYSVSKRSRTVNKDNKNPTASAGQVSID